MPGYNQQQLDYSVLNGNACAMLVGDLVVGFGQTASPGLGFGTESLHGIGSAKPQEIQQLKFSPTISLDSFMLTREGLARFGVTSSWMAILANNAFNIYAMDSSGLPLFTYVGCVAENFSANIPANQPVTQQTSFQAMDVLDTDGQSVLNSNSALQVGVALGTDFAAITSA